VTSLPTSWYERTQYGNIVKNMIKTQYKSFQKTKDPKFRLKLSQNTAYLIQVENSLISDFNNQIDFKKIQQIIAENNRLKMEKSNAAARAKYW